MRGPAWELHCRFRLLRAQGSCHAPVHADPAFRLNTHTASQPRQKTFSETPRSAQPTYGPIYTPRSIVEVWDIMIGVKALAAALLLLCITAGAKADDKPVADLLFVLSADQATFTSANTLTMQNVSATAQFYGKGARAGVTPTGAFVNSTAGAQYVAANGMWLNNPTATVYGFDANNTGHAVILTLADPTANSADKTLTFTVGVVSDKSAIKTSKGVANEEEAAASNQAGYLLTSVQPDTVLREVALFVDVNSESVQPDATEKDWFRPYYGGYGCGWGCGGYGYGGGYGYRRGWGGYGWGK